MLIKSSLFFIICIPKIFAQVTCVDKSIDICKSYNGYAGTSYCTAIWPKTNCKKTCGLCDQLSTPCIDNDPINCKSYSNYVGTSYCSINWAKTNCKKTCEWCK